MMIWCPSAGGRSGILPRLARDGESNVCACLLSLHSAMTCLEPSLDQVPSSVLLSSAQQPRYGPRQSIALNYGSRRHTTTAFTQRRRCVTSCRRSSCSVTSSCRCSRRSYRLANMVPSLRHRCHQHIRTYSGASELDLHFHHHLQQGCRISSQVPLRPFSARRMDCARRVGATRLCAASTSNF